jgi:16S rRNA (guanine1207-N2)-methyltransferase
MGMAVQNDFKNPGYTHAFLLSPKQKDEAKALMARAALALDPGGWLICAAPLDAGGKRLEDDAGELGFAGETVSKHHAKIFAAQKPEHFNSALAGDWVKRAALQPCPATGFMSQPGLFSWDRADKGSDYLLQALPEKMEGKGADLGCGWGYLARHVLERYPKVKKIHCWDADRRAVEACRINLEGQGERALFNWLDLTCEKPSETTLDWVVMNPPFHEGKARMEEIGQRFIAAAAGVLRRGGRLYMVANAGLPYEAALNDHFSIVNEIFKGNGYKVLNAVK